jgi:hypothetical protein
MPAVRDVRFEIRLPGGDKVVLPQSPMTIPADAFFHWPVNMELNGARLVYATAQPILKHTAPDGVLTIIFSETPGIRAEFAFDPLTLQNSTALESHLVLNAESWPARSLHLTTVSGMVVRIVVLSEKDSLWLKRKSKNEAPEFEKPTREQATPIAFEKVRAAGPLRDWRSKNPDFQLPVAPLEVDYQQAAAWTIRLPHGLDMKSNPILRIRYNGDSARLLLNGRVLNDDFHNGTAFEIGLRRHAPEILNGDLHLEILPLQEDMPVFFEPGTRPGFCQEGKALELIAVEIAEMFEQSERFVWVGDH